MSNTFSETNANGNSNGNGLPRHLNWANIPVEQMVEVNLKISPAP